MVAEVANTAAADSSTVVTVAGIINNTAFATVVYTATTSKHHMVQAPQPSMLKLAVQVELALPLITF